MSSQLRRNLRRLLLVVVAVLYAVSIPWYRETSDYDVFWLGLPDWVGVALLCYIAAAVCNACAWLLTDVRDEPEA